jgi:hypothetical protein
MSSDFFTRTMIDETIVGGPFVRYIPIEWSIYMIVETVEKSEYVRAFCPRIISDRWGIFTVGAFKKTGCDETQNYWAERIQEEVIVTDTMTIFQVPREDWMVRVVE